jgi:hypothetical protein
MPAKQTKRPRSQRKAPTQPSREKQASSASSAEPGRVHKKPFLDLCRQAGWTPQHLREPAGSNQEFTQLLIKELVACREAGELALTLGLCDAAAARGLQHSRIAANRERAVRAQQKSESVPETSPSKKRLRGSKAGSPEKRSKSLWRRLSTALSRRAQPTHDPKRRTKPAAPSPSIAAVEEQASISKREQQLHSLKGVCLKSGWAPQYLQTAPDGDLALGCALEMQRCRQAGQHALVVALATEAGVLGLDHPRIEENLKRSRAKAAKASVLSQVQTLLDANPPCYEAAVTLLADALVHEPDSGEYRKLLVQAVRQEITERSGDALTPEIRDATVDLHVNERLLDALQRRRSSDTFTGGS